LRQTVSRIFLANRHVFEGGRVPCLLLNRALGVFHLCENREEMAIHKRSSALSSEAIDEYIELARLGVHFTKPDGGCLGYPSTLLLFCVIDAMSCHLNYKPYSLGVLKHPLFDLDLTPDQIKKLKIWYRDPLAHNGMIAPGTILTPETEGDAIEFTNGEPLRIRVKVLFQLVENAWKAFDRKALVAKRSKEPKTPIDLSGRTFEIPEVSSGCVVKPKVRMM
jgi:hypothetical protein